MVDRPNPPSAVAAPTSQLSADIRPMSPSVFLAENPRFNRQRRSARPRRFEWLRQRRRRRNASVRAAYDSRADAVSIDLANVGQGDRREGVDGDHCTVSFSGDRPVNVKLIAPDDHLELLTLAADRYGLDGEALQAAARSALAAPDRPVVLDVLAR